MANSSDSAVNSLLSDSKAATELYQNRIIEYESMNSLDSSSPLKSEDASLIADFEQLLEHTRKELRQDINSDRISQIDPLLISGLDHTITNLMNRTDAKIKEIHYAIYGLTLPIPFLTVLRDIQNLLRTISSLNASRGGKVAKMENLEDEGNSK